MRYIREKKTGRYLDDYHVASGFPFTVERPDHAKLKFSDSPEDEVKLKKVIRDVDPDGKRFEIVAL